MEDTHALIEASRLRTSVRYTIEGRGAPMHLLRITLIERVAVSMKLESIKILYIWLEKLQKISNGASERRYASLRLSHHVPPMKETNYQLEPGQDHKISCTLFFSAIYNICRKFVTFEGPNYIVFTIDQYVSLITQAHMMPVRIWKITIIVSCIHRNILN